MLGTVPVHQPISPAVAHLPASTLPQLPALQAQLLQSSIRPEFLSGTKSRSRWDILLPELWQLQRLGTIQHTYHHKGPEKDILYDLTKPGLHVLQGVSKQSCCIAQYVKCDELACYY